MKELVIQTDDLNEEQQQLAELIGLDNFAKLVQVFGGTRIYIPKQEVFSRVVRNEKIRQEYNGRNIKILATKHGLTEVQIRNILGEAVCSNRTRVLPGQMSIFDFLNGS